MRPDVHLDEERGTGVVQRLQLLAAAVESFLADRIETRRDERALDGDRIGDQNVEIARRSRRRLRIAGCSFGAFEEHDWPVARLPHALKQERHGERRHRGRTSLGNQVTRNRTSGLLPAREGEQLEPVRPEVVKGGNAVEEPVHALPQARV
jgi:hypothetical protein